MATAEPDVPRGLRRAPDTLPQPVDRLERRERLRRRRRLKRIALAVVALLALAWAGYAWSLRGQTAPNVKAAGVDVGGLSAGDARARLEQELGPRLNTPVNVKIGDQVVAVTPAALGIGLDLQRMVDEALQQDRVASRVLPMFGGGSTVPIRLVPPEKPRLTPAVKALEKKPVDATLTVTPAGQVKTTPAADGLDVPPSLLAGAVIEAVRAGRTDAAIDPRVLPPTVPTSAATSAADEAKKLLAAPIVLTSKNTPIGKVEPKELAPALIVSQKDAGFTVRIDADRLARAVAGDVKPLMKTPVDAHFRTQGDRAFVVPAKNGVELDPIGTARLVRAAGLSADARRTDVALRTEEPDLTTAKAKSWHVTNQISSITTDLGASSANRVFNVQLIAHFLDGKVVPPGETFSFNDYVGPRTVERGFKEGSAIVGGLLLPSIGGGVCQAATTVYDAAFYAGYPILQRRNHDFYISHYALGMDATVSMGGPDLQFKNDTDSGILIRAWAGDSTMTVVMYSKPRGIDVTKTVGDRTNSTAPGKRYILDSSLKQGQISQTTSGESGFDVTIARTVKQHGKVLRQDSFQSHYTPEDIIYRIGPNTPAPGGATVENPPPGLDD